MQNERRAARPAKHGRAAILLATDFSRPARRAYAYALALASVLKSRLILLHVVKAPPASRPGLRPPVIPWDH